MDVWIQKGCLCSLSALSAACISTDASLLPASPLIDCLSTSCVFTDCFDCLCLCGPCLHYLCLNSTIIVFADNCLIFFAELSLVHNMGDFHVVFSVHVCACVELDSFALYDVGSDPKPVSASPGSDTHVKLTPHVPLCFTRLLHTPRIKLCTVSLE